VPSVRNQTQTINIDLAKRPPVNLMKFSWMMDLAEDAAIIRAQSEEQVMANAVKFVKDKYVEAQEIT
jgi:hypothetical protein